MEIVFAWAVHFYDDLWHGEAEVSERRGNPLTAWNYSTHVAKCTFLAGSFPPLIDGEPYMSELGREIERQRDPQKIRYKLRCWAEVVSVGSGGDLFLKPITDGRGIRDIPVYHEEGIVWRDDAGEIVPTVFSPISEILV